MSPLQADDSVRWTKKIQDAIADNSALRDGLTDDEAMPLIDWGAARAEQIGARMAAPDTPAPDEEQVSSTAYALTRLMTRITWVVTYRHKKDAAWLTRTFNKINDLSNKLHGPDVPALSEDEIAAWIAEHKQYSNGELVNKLIARLTPPTTPDTPGAPPDIPPDTLPGVSPDISPDSISPDEPLEQGGTQYD
jgi:hypothetical protein